MLARLPPIGAVLISTCWMCSTATGQTAQPESRRVEDTAKRVVDVSVDPRVELVSIIFRLAGHPEYNQGRLAGYVQAVDEHFAAQREHDVVKLARELRGTRGVTYNACMSLAVHLRDAESLAERTPLDPLPRGVDPRWTTQHARRFVELARDFAAKSDFAGFLRKHRPMYQQAEVRMRALLERSGRLEWFDRYFGARQGAQFAIVLAPVNGPQNYAVTVHLPDGREELYCILGVWTSDEAGVPTFDESVLGTVVHEFTHCYTNPLVYRHETELRPAGERMFPLVAQAMREQAYGDWQTMMCESLVRACVVRYLAANRGLSAAVRQVEEERGRSFVWVEPLSDLLIEYETQRERYADFDAFMPRIVAFFDEYAPRFEREQAALNAQRPKIVRLIPSNGAQRVDPQLSALVIEFDRPMTDRSWSIVGGGPNFPEITASPSYDSDRKVLTVPVRLKPEWDYVLWLNRNQFQNFISAEGVPLEPVEVRFSTGPLQRP